MKFNKWIDTFISEKNLNTEHVFEIEGGEWGTNYIPLGCVIDAIKTAPASEQAEIKTVIVKIDFHNGDVMDFFAHLAQAIAI